MTKRVLPLILLAAALAAPAAAQRRAAPDAGAARLDAAPPAAVAPTPRGSRAGARPSLVTVLGGALIGAGAGYLTSQVAWSDWDKSSNSEFRSRRLSFTLGGSAVGALTGLLVGRRLHAGAAVPATVPGRPATGSSVITEEEVRASTAANVYQLVQALRPMWLRRDGASGRTIPSTDPEAPATVSSPVADAGVRVYVERGFVGDIFSLRQIPVAEVTSVEFLDAAAATYRLGPGNPSGAIVVHTGLRQR
jgi:hypothetical protein